MRAPSIPPWQTRLLRFSKLQVADEIENALSYYEATFLREIPRVYATLERSLAEDWANVDVIAAHKREREELQALLARWEALFEQAQA